VQAWTDESLAHIHCILLPQSLLQSFHYGTSRKFPAARGGWWMVTEGGVWFLVGGVWWMVGSGLGGGVVAGCPWMF